MLYRPSSFRKSAIALTTTAAMLAGTSFFAVTQPASAQQLSSGRGAPACAHIVDSTEGIKCEVRESMRRTEESNKRGTVANKTSAAAKESVSCMGIVEKDIVAAKAKGPLTPDMKAAFKTRIEKCDRVSSL
jgi:hypothetical protein